MHTHEQVVPRYSPALWGLATLGAVATLGGLGVLAWNAWEYRELLLERAARLVRIT